MRLKLGCVAVGVQDVQFADKVSENESVGELSTVSHMVSEGTRLSVRLNVASEVVIDGVLVVGVGVSVVVSSSDQLRLRLMLGVKLSESVQLGVMDASSVALGVGWASITGKHVSVTTAAVLELSDAVAVAESVTFMQRHATAAVVVAAVVNSGSKLPTAAASALGLGHVSVLLLADDSCAPTNRARLAPMRQITRVRAGRNARRAMVRGLLRECLRVLILCGVNNGARA